MKYLRALTGRTRRAAPPMTPTANTIHFADFSSCEPAANLSRERVRGKWRLVDFSADGVDGTMVFAVPGEGAQPIALPIDVRGFFRVFVGINYSRYPWGDRLHFLPWPLYGQVQLKLDGDPGYSRFAFEGGWDGDLVDAKTIRGSRTYLSIQETMWRVHEFTGPTRLWIASMEEPYSDIAGARLSNIAYIKLVPVSPEEQAEWERLKPRPETRNLAMIWCSGMLSGHAMGSPMYHPTSTDWFRDEMAPFAGTDIGVFIFEAIRGNLAMYPTKVGDTGAPDNLWDPSWVNPVTAFRDQAREHGMKILAGLRMMGPGFPMIDEPIGWGNFYWKNQQWAKKDRDGNPCTNVSLAYPEVRQHWLAMARETLDYGVDGIALYLHRCQPFVLFEEPVVESFREKYGEDARQLHMEDPRLRRHWAEYVTQFVREMHALVHEKPGRSLALMFFGAPFKYDVDDAYNPLRYNCDVDTWIREGLADYLLPMVGVDPRALAHWRQLAGDKTHIWVDMMPRMQPGAQFARQARGYYEAGADGLCFWDGERRPPHSSEWAVMSRLGHRDQLDFLEREAPGFHRFFQLDKLWGFNAQLSFKDG